MEADTCLSGMRVRDLDSPHARAGNANSDRRRQWNRTDVLWSSCVQWITSHGIISSRAKPAQNACVENLDAKLRDSA